MESPIPRPPRARGARKSANATGPSLHLLAGYSVLVVDTNILLSSLSMFASVVESHRWTVIVPLPVVMELDGLSANTNALGEAAAAALAYVTASLRTHARSLKVQTSKGNYLSNLAVRTEQVDFDGDWERNMDDLILRAAIWQDEHWMDRSTLLGSDAPTETKGVAKVVLLSFDRNRACLSLSVHWDV
jgi:protein SMG6